MIPHEMGNMARLGCGLLSLGLLVAGCGDDHDAEASEAFNQAFEELEDNKADDAGCSGVLTPDRSGFGKRIALTFDDGPNPATTPKVLDTLKAEGIQATFFINGNRVNASTRPILQRIIDEGHILANHTQSHKNMAQQNNSTVRSQIAGPHEIIGEYTTPEYFRFPYGSSTCNTARIVREDFGQIVTGWNVDSGDWCYARNDGYCSPSTFRHIPDGFRNDMPGWTMQQVRSKGGGIVLFHDIHEYVAGALPGIISTMKSEGYTFTNLDDTETFPLLNGVQLPWVGDACDGDDDCNLGADFDDALCEFNAIGENGMCTLECEGTCPDRGTATTFCVSLDDGMSGSCVLKATASNANCEAYPHTVMETRDRFIGSSNASARTDRVCVPR
ncbi:MAG: polysaccharide deacetylase family protein [Myxococcota bacterium]